MNKAKVLSFWILKIKPMSLARYTVIKVFAPVAKIATRTSVRLDRLHTVVLQG